MAMQTSVIGFPRIGASRELKFAVEKYFKGEMDMEELQRTAANLRSARWNVQKAHGMDWIPSNDFSFYDHMLDTAVLLNLIPERYQALELPPMDTYFAMARGYQGPRGDVKALAMKKWFNTNYHYLVPEIEDSAQIRIAGSKIFDEYREAKQQQLETKPVLVGAFTLLKLAKYTGRKRAEHFISDIARAYQDVLTRLDELGAQWIQLDEPCLVTDLTPEDIRLFAELYRSVLSAKKGAKLVIQTYFGDVRDCYETLQTLPFDGIGLDFAEGAKTLSLLRQHGFAEDKTLFAGIINGRNIWKNRYAVTLQTVQDIQRHTRKVVLSPSCSLLHVPYSIHYETRLSQELTKYFAFAEEKLQELAELKQILSSPRPMDTEEYKRNTELFAGDRSVPDASVRARTAALTERDFARYPALPEREAIQNSKLKLPLLPTTTIGSFPQTPDVRSIRAAFKKKTVSETEYKQFLFGKIEQCIRQQEEIGLDVLVHGEFERSDMVEYFGECLEGFVFTDNGWVQSYGTRCVKPPIIWGDVRRSKPITVEYAVYANRLSDKPVKGMLTGPVTMLNWSFPREDLSPKEIAFQIALAIRDEVLDLEAHHIDIIQIDEAALREKLPLRKSDWHEQYLSWAIPAFRLVHSGVKPETQIHTHMCYSQFQDMIREIDAMDADVITFEASRSDLEIVKALQQSGFQTRVGPGVYDIHSPRIPDVEELKQAIRRMIQAIGSAGLWINPDCGLKTRGEAETWASLRNLVQAASEIRAELQHGSVSNETARIGSAAVRSESQRGTQAEK
jgi:5-methyltetrahydropteroyltriglutamate--homocysteine methyltransferase